MTTLPIRQEYRPELASRGGWLGAFYCFSFLSGLAFLRSAMATVISGSGGGLTALILAVVILVAWLGLLMRKRWAYYVLLAVGVFWFAVTAVDMIAAPERMLVTDWAFDLPTLSVEGLPQ